MTSVGRSATSAGRPTPIAVRLPLPPLWNHSRGFNRKSGHYYVTEEVRTYKENAGFIAWSQGVREPVVWRGDVTIRLYREACRGDSDGWLKILLDALQGVVYVNDRQVRDIFLYVREDKQEPRAEVHFAPIDGD